MSNGRTKQIWNSIQYLCMKNIVLGKETRNWDVLYLHSNDNIYVFVICGEIDVKWTWQMFSFFVLTVIIN